MTGSDSLDYLIVGAGPAGVQIGYFLHKAGRSYRIVEAGDAPGTFFTRFPRHRTMISNNKVNTGWDDPELNLRMDWNSLLTDEYEPLFTKVTPRYFPPADDFVRYLADFVEQHGLHIDYRTRITRITRPDDFVVEADDGRVLRARRLVMATGVTKPYLPDIEGIADAESYAEVSVEPTDFTNKRVLILGRGNSAFETADNLVETAAVIHVAGPGSLRLAWQTHFVGHLRAVNNNFLDTYQLKSQNALLDGRVTAIRKQPDGTYRVSVAFDRVNEIVKEIPYDRVIIATGFRFDASIFAEECRPELTIKDRFPNQTEAWESTNVPDVYFVGTITQVRDFKKSTSGFIHGFRYGAKALYRILETRYHDTPWPARALPLESEAVADAIVARVNRSSALWQQFGFIGDAVLLTADGTPRYLEEVPLDYLHSAVRAGAFGAVDSYFGITLEYGPDHDRVNPFEVTVARPAQQEGGVDGRYLHPVVRHFRAGEVIGEHHLTENLENEWDSEEVHRAPLRTFLSGELDEPATATVSPA
ncbi:NAD(P)-binding domain-containing protein [Streptomyces odontomachi]|uniref:NAD(P)-binding domain-containing protein n=1 Tax=Streptomyces odontomachi TaxID=2944940 RepID=UPI00210AC8FE|nr:NAD(P)-binding domain-containing protein [Streptomyces sp. ODS25]